MLKIGKKLILGYEQANSDSRSHGHLIVNIQNRYGYSFVLKALLIYMSLPGRQQERQQ